MAISRRHEFPNNQFCFVKFDVPKSILQPNNVHLTREIWGSAPSCHYLSSLDQWPSRGELEELRLEAYENSRIYKRRVKQFHDNRILRKESKQESRTIPIESKGVLAK
ncbi:hypothetical protein CR513_22996, partial [Mucuna pruriens]